MAAQSPQDHTEVEWQFDAPSGLAHAEAWLRAANVPGFVVKPGPLKQLEDRYLDTADWRLNRAGFTCRVRSKGDGVELTLKGMATSSDGMRSRREINEPIAHVEGSVVDTAAGHCGRAIRAVAGRAPILELFTVRTNRQLFNLLDSAGVVGEIALDDTTVIANEGAKDTLQRIEVEVDADNVERARRFVDLFIATGGLVPATKSKFETGMVVSGLPAPRRSPDLGFTQVAATQTAGEVGYAVMRKHFGVFLANEPGTRLGEDIEGLHDMRVAARRLRAAMSAFRSYLPPAAERYREQLGWVAAALGEVRDLDVQLENMATWREGFSAHDAAALDAIEALFLDRRVAARRRMLFVLDSRRYDGFVSRFSRFLVRGAPRTFEPGTKPALAAAPDLLEKRYRQVRKLGDAIKRDSPPADYHILRIAAKKLRYALEFTGPIYGPAAIAFSQRVTALQDVLGKHQDAEVAVDALSELARVNARRLGPASMLVMGAIAERNRVEAEHLRRQFPDVYKPIRGREWKKLRGDIEDRRPDGPP